MKKYIKFAIISVILLALPWYFCLSSTAMFGVVMVSIPAVIYFFARFLASLVYVIQKKEVRYNASLMILCLFLVFSLKIPADIADHGTRKLTLKRRDVIQSVRPIFLQYKTDHGAYPRTLQELVPKYIVSIPPELINDGHEWPFHKISYNVENGEPMFFYHTISGPDSAESYNIDKDTFWQDP